MSPREYLFSLEHLGIKLGLEQIRALLEALGRPDLAYRSLVIAGTNGKGSVTAMVERALRAAGYRTGRYTSPHLVDLEERFAIDGVPIAPEELDAIATRVETAARSLAAPPSFFEATTALALEAFRDAGVDVAVLEVGLGGRLDATNVVASSAVAITSIDFDHQEYLGHTLAAIAAEKAGVIKPGGLVVLGDNPAEVQDVVRGIANDRGARLVYAPDGVSCEAAMVDGLMRLRMETPRAEYEPLTLGLRGRHQIANAILATRLLEELDEPTPAIRAGLELVSWPGRLELGVWQGHEVLIDGAHNPAGARALAAYVREAYGRALPIVVGAMRDKHIDEMLAALAPIASSFFCTAADSPRAASPDDLATIARTVAPNVPVERARNPLEALRSAVARGNPVIVAGSLYLAGEIRSKLS